MPITTAGIFNSDTTLSLASVEPTEDLASPLYQELQDRFTLIDKVSNHGLSSNHELSSNVPNNGLLSYVPNVFMFTDLDRWQISGLVANISKDRTVLYPPLSLLFNHIELDSFEEEHERRIKMFQQWWDEYAVGSVILILTNMELLDTKTLDIVSDKIRKSTGAFVMFSRKDEVERFGRLFPRLAIIKEPSKTLIWNAETDFIDSFNQTIKGLSPEESKKNIEAGLQTAELEQVGRPLATGLSSWDRICGYRDIKTRLQDLLYKGARDPERMLKLGLAPVKGILLHGPSGCGKTEIVKAIANDAVFPVIKIQPTDILSKYLGESESKLRQVFSKAREVRPCILFIDNIEVLGGRRNIGGSDTTGSSERLLSTLLNEMDGIAESLGVILVCCTNRLEDLDEALVRPGRLDHHIHIPLPTRDDLRELLDIWCEKLQIDLDCPDNLCNLLSERSCANVLAILNEFALSNLDAPLPLQSSELMKFIMLCES
ncbi:hypothetical protein PSACC_00921 [Paramicrosporidium saccamoebae]|uniref:AAA+ ATPase domain-containing protein n=1 Tax=Paramicrosporidium saccamoebae TaxID=1246581 RepID=A0A2H9TNA2_9FUNG|nr:hypothetical protein PSACC_00921 [Paramicrosporidium saccamoebae]